MCTDLTHAPVATARAAATNYYYREHIAMQRTKHPNYYIYTTKVTLCTQRLSYYRWETIQLSAEKVPVPGASRKKWRLEIQNTYTALVPGSRISVTRYVVPGIF